MGEGGRQSPAAPRPRCEGEPRDRTGAPARCSGGGPGLPGSAATRSATERFPPLPGANPGTSSAPRGGHGERRGTAWGWGAARPGPAGFSATKLFTPEFADFPPFLPLSYLFCSSLGVLWVFWKVLRSSPHQIHYFQLAFAVPAHIPPAPQLFTFPPQTCPFLHAFVPSRQTAMIPACAGLPRLAQRGVMAAAHGACARTHPRACARTHTPAHAPAHEVVIPGRQRA